MKVGDECHLLAIIDETLVHQILVRHTGFERHLLEIEQINACIGKLSMKVRQERLILWLNWPNQYGNARVGLTTPDILSRVRLDRGLWQLLRSQIGCMNNNPWISGEDSS